jgi:hypothetical protein
MQSSTILLSCVKKIYIEKREFKNVVKDFKTGNVPESWVLYRARSSKVGNLWRNNPGVMAAGIVPSVNLGQGKVLDSNPVVCR